MGSEGGRAVRLVLGLVGEAQSQEKYYWDHEGSMDRGGDCGQKGDVRNGDEGGGSRCRVETRHGGLKPTLQKDGDFEVKWEK